MNKPMAIVSARCAERFGDTLAEHFSRLFPLPPDPSLDAPVADHPDMILSIVDGKLILHESYYHANRRLIDEIADLGGLEIITSTAPRGKKYPADVGFNALVTDTHIFGRIDVLAPEVIFAAREANLTPANTKQGYAGCGVLYVRGTVITGDVSIAASAESVGLSVVYATDIKIALAGYDKGFIGGASGAYGNTVFTLGDLSETDGAEPILRHFATHGITPVNLAQCPLEDFGGIKIISSEIA